MSFFLLLVSLVLIVKGITMILVPKKMMKLAARLLKVKEPRLWGLAPLAIGILLLFAASKSILGWLIVLLGLMEISKAVYIFISPSQMPQHWSSNLKENAYRIWGIWSLVLGVIIFITRI